MEDDPKYQTRNLDFHQVEHKSHFWSDLASMEEFFKTAPLNEAMRSHILIGIRNTRKRGYELKHTSVKTKKKF